jgi:hypothetical protein
LKSIGRHGANPSPSFSPYPREEATNRITLGANFLNTIKQFAHDIPREFAKENF